VSVFFSAKKEKCEEKQEQSVPGFDPPKILISDQLPTPAVKSGVDAVKRLSKSLTVEQNKLECLSWQFSYL